MNWMRWKPGRQGSGYDKMLLATGRWPLPFDCYLLRYPVGSFIAAHIDPVDGMRHFRVNVVLRPALAGGKFLLNREVQRGRIHRFRPDLESHGVTPVLGRSRWVLSFGWVRP